MEYVYGFSLDLLRQAIYGSLASLDKDMQDGIEMTLVYWVVAGKKASVHILLRLFLECPRTSDRMELFACPTPDFRGRYRCIDDRVLCNGFFDCPGHEDENPDQCLFYKTVSCSFVCLNEFNESQMRKEVGAENRSPIPILPYLPMRSSREKNGRVSCDFPCHGDLRLVSSTP